MSPEKKIPRVEYKPDFETEAIRVERLTEVSDLLKSDVNEAAEKYGLEERERHLLNIELAYFRINPETATDEVRHSYYQAYEEAAEKIIFGHANRLNDLGWRMRWGINVDAVNRAVRAEIGFSADQLISGTANELMYVIFNFKHDEILDEHGLCLRKLGREKN